DQRIAFAVLLPIGCQHRLNLGVSGRVLWLRHLKDKILTLISLQLLNFLRDWFGMPTSWDLKMERSAGRILNAGTHTHCYFRGGVIVSRTDEFARVQQDREQWSHCHRRFPLRVILFVLCHYRGMDQAGLARD